MIVDETISSFTNVNVLPFADAIVSSLTKVFAGECNVMGGRYSLCPRDDGHTELSSLVLNGKGPFYARLKTLLGTTYEDTYWPEDAIYMERNSRDFTSRVRRINGNAEAICDALLASSIGSFSIGCLFSELDEVA